jgi:methionyl-tRNA formyltransferase
MDGLIRLDEIQLEGKKRMDARSFLNGAHLEEGARLK